MADRPRSPAERRHSDRVSGVRAIEMHLSVPDASGRQTPQPTEGSQHTIPADMVIEALGFEPEDLPALFKEEALKVTDWGTVKTNSRTLMTSMDGVFAAGDIKRGASLVVWAIRDGRDAAASITRYLNDQSARSHAAAE